MEKNYVKGLFINKPSDKAPDFVAYNCSGYADSTIEWIKNNTDANGKYQFSILKKYDGSAYGIKNERKPEETFIKKEGKIEVEELSDMPVNEYGQEPRKSFESEINIEDIPFN